MIFKGQIDTFQDQDFDVTPNFDVGYKGFSTCQDSLEWLIRAKCFRTAVFIILMVHLLVISISSYPGSVQDILYIYLLVVLKELKILDHASFFNSWGVK